MSSLNRYPQGSVAVLSFREILASGMTRTELRNAVRSGTLRHPRRDVYVARSAGDRLLIALRIGGRLACGDALAHRGVWVEPRGTGRVHVALRPPNSRLRDEHGRSNVPVALIDARRHWNAERFGPGDRCAVDSRDALLGELGCRGPEAALAAADSAVRLGALTLSQARAALGAAQRRGVPLSSLIDPSAESGYETWARLVLRDAGVPYQAQARVPGVGRVDFLVASGLIFEVDGRRFHEPRFEEDRRRDTAAARIGYLTLRVSARQLREDRAGVLLAVREHVARLDTWRG